MLTSGGRANILIVDDERQIRWLLRSLLCESCECTEAGSAEEALDLLRRREFNLILSDITMGGITGLEMIPRVLDLAPDTVVIMVSGEGHIESAIEAMRAGAFDYVTKPFDFRQVEAAVRRGLEHRALLAAKRRYERDLEELVKRRTEEGAGEETAGGGIANQGGGQEAGLPVGGEAGGDTALHAGLHYPL
ncbi:MAG TPA: response regulator [Pyrinomonadaceae bacterium]